MPDLPCGDITCICCYPEFRCDCLNGRPADAEPGTVHACPDCGRTMEAVAYRDSPSYRVMAPLLAKHGLREPKLSWRQLTPATRIPGSAP